MKKFSKIILVFFSSIFGLAQKGNQNIGNEVVNIVKAYTPTISDAFKIKEVPASEDEIVEKKLPVNYKIFSFPVASTFVPNKGKAADVEKEVFEIGKNNYISLGFGNYTNILGEAFVTHQINNSDYVGALLKHFSSQGGINDLVLPDKFSKSGIDVTYGSKNKGYQWNIDLGFQNNSINWYGLPTKNFAFSKTIIDKIDPSQSYNSIYLLGRMEFTESIFNKASILFKRFSDKFDSGENRFFFTPEIKFEFNDIKISSDFTVDYVGGKFAKDFSNLNSIDYSNFIIGARPSFNYKIDDFSFDLGLGLFYKNQKENTESESKLYFYPNAKASYRIMGDLMIAYAGLEGNLQQNTYADFVSQNAFVSPTLSIGATDNVFDIYVGMKGKITNSVSFNVNGGLKNQKYAPFFVSNPYNNAITDPKGYHFANSFDVVYDNLNTIHFFGEIKADFSKNTQFGIATTYNIFSTSTLEKAFNMPQIKVEANLETNITDKLFAGAQVFFVGDRFNLEWEEKIIPNQITSYNTKIVSLESFIDLNAHIGYKLNQNFSFYVKGNNLANQSYQRWSNYPVQGINGILGAVYKFDF